MSSVFNTSSPSNQQMQERLMSVLADTPEFVDLCGQMGIQIEWFGDGQLHQIESLGGDSIPLTLEFKFDQTNGFVLHGLLPDPKTYDPTSPREFWRLVRWEFSIKRGMIRHAYTCDDVCDCGKKHMIMACLVQQTPYNEVIGHKDFCSGCEFMGFDASWIRDNKPHTWTRTDRSETKQRLDRNYESKDNSIKEKDAYALHNQWTIDANVDDNGILYFFGKFTVSEEDASRYQNQNLTVSLIE